MIKSVSPIRRNRYGKWSLAQRFHFFSCSLLLSIFIGLCGCGDIVYLTEPIGDPVPEQDLKQALSGVWHLKLSDDGDVEVIEVNVIADGLVSLILQDAITSNNDKENPDAGQDETRHSVRINKLEDVWLLIFESSPDPGDTADNRLDELQWYWIASHGDQLWLAMPEAKLFAEAICKGDLYGRIERVRAEQPQPDNVVPKDPVMKTVEQVPFAGEFVVNTVRSAKEKPHGQGPTIDTFKVWLTGPPGPIREFLENHSPLSLTNPPNERPLAVRVKPKP
ncbi:MAG: hypothetical protein AAF797_15775 [Planctomycetota bacterium]